jgi:Protein of unknown function, DUF547
MQKRTNSMMKQFFLAIVFSGIATAGAYAQDSKDFFDKTDKFMAANVKNGMVSYKTIAANKAALDELVTAAGKKYRFASATDEKAFYLNAYNVFVIKGLINAYPVKGPLDITGFFDKKTFLVNGASLTLNQLENDIVRKKYNDARIHFALVCGAKSCPPLPSYGYKPSTLDSQLENLARQSIQSSSFTKIDYKKKTAAISMIFNWYKDDFIKAKGSVEAFLNSYLKTPLPQGTVIINYEYDWTLNGK